MIDSPLGKTTSTSGFLTCREVKEPMIENPPPPLFCFPEAKVREIANKTVNYPSNMHFDAEPSREPPNFDRHAARFVKHPNDVCEGFSE